MKKPSTSEELNETNTEFSRSTIYSNIKRQSWFLEIFKLKEAGMISISFLFIRFHSFDINGTVKWHSDIGSRYV